MADIKIIYFLLESFEHFIITKSIGKALFAVIDCGIDWEICLFTIDSHYFLDE